MRRPSHRSSRRPRCGLPPRPPTSRRWRRTFLPRPLHWCPHEPATAILTSPHAYNREGEAISRLRILCSCGSAAVAADASNGARPQRRWRGSHPGRCPLGAGAVRGWSAPDGSDASSRISPARGALAVEADAGPGQVRIAMAPGGNLRKVAVERINPVGFPVPPTGRKPSTRRRDRPLSSGHATYLARAYRAYLCRAGDGRSRGPASQSAGQRSAPGEHQREV